MFVLAGALLADIDTADDVAPMVTGIVSLLVAAVGVWVFGRRGSRGNAEIAVQQERRRIGRELHDIVGHGLVVVALHARRLPGLAPQTRPIARAIDETAQNTLQEVRRMVGVLRVSGAPGGRVEEATLSSQIVDLTARLPRGPISVVLDGAECEHLVSPRLRTTMLRVVQEGLTNALKHAEGKRVQISLHFDDEVLLTVATGVSPTAELRDGTGGGNGHGLFGLRERVIAEGGSFESGPVGDGFLIRARLPVPSMRGDRPEDGKVEWIPSAS